MRSRLLPALLLAGAVRADTVVLVDGKVLDGRVTETEQGVQVLLANGGSIFVPRDRVARIERKPSDVEIFQARRKALSPRDARGRVELAEWARERRMERAVRNLAQEALALEPENAQARALLGQVRVGGTWLTEEEAARRGFARLREGWGEWDEKYAEEERSLGLPVEALEKARRALEDPEAMAALGLPAKAWTVLLHRPAPEAPRELPCLLVLDASETRALAEEAAKAAPAAAVLAAPAPEALLAVLDAGRDRVDRTRVVLVAAGEDAEAAWGLLASRPDLFSCAVLGGAPGEADLPFLANAEDLDLFALQDPSEAPEVAARRHDAAQRLVKSKGRVLDYPRTELGAAVSEALGRRRNPRPTAFRRRVGAPGTFGWVRVDALVPQGAPKGDFPWLEARVTPRNSIFLATRHLRRVTLLLSDDLVDLSQPVTVTLNGIQAFQGPLKPDLKTLVDSRKSGGRHRLTAAALPLEVPP